MSALARSAKRLAGVCLIASLGGLLFGFDTAVISGTVERVTEQYGLSEVQMGWFTSAALIGCIVGALCSGWLGDRFGRKPMLILSASLFFVSALFSAIAWDYQSLVVARIVGGLGVGVASVLGPMYISELAPAKSRGRLVAFYQLSIVLGILVAYLSNLVIAKYASASADIEQTGLWHKAMVSEVWRGMFAAEMLPAGVFLLLLFFVPESPRWLVKAGRSEQALHQLKKIRDEAEAARELAQIRADRSRGQGKVSELLRPGLRLALLVGVMLSVFGQLSGVNIVVYYGPMILAAAGFEELATLLAQVGIGIVMLVVTLVALLLIDKLGRRPLLIGGMTVVSLSLFIIATLFYTSGAEEALAKGQAVPRSIGIAIGVMMCVYMAAISFSISAVIWVLTPEIFPNRIRGRAASICTFSNWSSNAAAAFMFPWYVAAFGMHAGFYTSAVTCVIAVVFFFFLVPETRGKSLEEIESLWQEKRADGIAAIESALDPR